MSEQLEEAPGGGVSVTIKYGKGYEHTWAGFRGSVRQVRDNIIGFFGMTPEETTGLTLSEVVTNATTLAHAKGNLGGGLGGVTALPHSEKPKQAGDPWAGTQQAAKPEDGDGLTEAVTKEIEATKTVDELKLVYGKNKGLFDSRPELLAVWKAHGRKLSGK